MACRIIRPEEVDAGAADPEAVKSLAERLPGIEWAAAAAKDGIEVEVLDLRTLLPLDKQAILATARKTGKVIVLHEATRTGGPGGEVAALVTEEAFEWLDAPVVRIAPPDTPVPYSPPLEEYFLPNAENVGKAIRALYDY